MAYDAFLKLGDIEGESTDKSHKGEIEVLSFSWSIARGTRGRAKVSDFLIVKSLDKASPLLFDAACSGDRIPEAHFSLRKAGDRPLDFYKIKFSDVLVSSVSPAGSSSNDLPMEKLSLSFSRSEITFTPQNATGGGGAPVVSSCSPRSDRD